MLEILKEAHKAADLLRAKAAEAQAAVATGERHVAALVVALTAEEKALYDAFVAEREKAKPKL